MSTGYVWVKNNIQHVQGTWVLSHIFSEKSLSEFFGPFTILHANGTMCESLVSLFSITVPCISAPTFLYCCLALYFFQLIRNVCSCAPYSCFCSLYFCLALYFCHCTLYFCYCTLYPIFLLLRLILLLGPILRPIFLLLFPIFLLLYPVSLLLRLILPSFP